MGEKGKEEKPNPIILAGIAVVLVVGIAIGASFIGTSGSPYLDDCNSKEDPILIRECLSQFCIFDVSQCQINCPIGYQNDDAGCPMSCECASSGLREFDIQFTEDEVPKLLEAYSESPVDEVIVSASSRSFPNSPAFALFFGSVISEKMLLWLTLRDTSDNRIKIPYKIEDSMPSGHKSQIQKAFSEYKKKTCIDFIPFDSSSQDHKLWHIIFIYESGCWSYVGKAIPNGQEISIGEGCQSVGTVEHEIMHALGFAHEQCRPDRDSYVKINFDNIKKGVEGNFKKMTADRVVDLKSKYDVGSIMHYSGTAFAIDHSSPSIVDLETGRGVVSQRGGFSDEDLNEINAIYECNPSSQGGQEAQWGQWEGWSSPDKTCGTAKVFRFRKCQLNGQQASGCKGEASECKNDVLAECPDAGENQKQWGPWKLWSGCTKPCGRGHRARVRPCGGVLYGPGCPVTKENNFFEMKFCNSDICPGDTATWTEWSDWTPCSESCKQGWTYIEATCFTDPKQNMNQYISYNCPGGDGGGKRYRTKACNIGMTSCQSPGQGRSSFGNSTYNSELMNKNNEAENGVGDFIIPKTESPVMCEEGDGHYTFGDFNGDGIDDVLCSLTPTTFAQYIMTDGVPREVWKGLIEQCSLPDQRFIKDMNGDGTGDVLCNNKDRTVIKYADQDGILGNEDALDVGIKCDIGRIITMQNNNARNFNIGCQHNWGLEYFVNYD